MRNNNYLRWLLPFKRHNGRGKYIQLDGELYNGRSINLEYISSSVECSLTSTTSYSSTMHWTADILLAGALLVLSNPKKESLSPVNSSNDSNLNDFFFFSSFFRLPAHEMYSNNLLFSVMRRDSFQTSRIFIGLLGVWVEKEELFNTFTLPLLSLSLVLSLLPQRIFTQLTALCSLRRLLRETSVLSSLWTASLLLHFTRTLESALRLQHFALLCIALLCLHLTTLRLTKRLSASLPSSSSLPRSLGYASLTYLASSSSSYSYSSSSSYSQQLAVLVACLLLFAGDAVGIASFLFGIISSLLLNSGP